MASQFFNNKKPFNLLDYNEDIGHVVSNFVKDGKYDIAIFLHIPCARFSHPARIQVPLARCEPHKDRPLRPKLEDLWQMWLCV